MIVYIIFLIGCTVVAVHVIRGNTKNEK